MLTIYVVVAEESGVVLVVEPYQTEAGADAAVKSIREEISEDGSVTRHGPYVMPERSAAA